EAIELTRGLSRGLDPVEIERGGLAQGLRDLVAQTRSLTTTQCEYRGDAVVEIGDGFAATHLYRIAQEAITNAIKHGHAGAVDVSLERVNGRVRLTVRDDGVGIPEPAQRRLGMGLRIMAHRAAVMG